MRLLLTTALAFSSLYCFSQQADTFTVQFRRNDPKLTADATASLDKLVKKGVINGKKIQVLGYADFRGTKEHNDSITAERAQNVKNYLVSKGIPAGDITQCAGRGKLEHPPVSGVIGFPPDRKVLIIVEHGTSVEDFRKTEVNQTVALKNILFEGGLPDILPSSMPEFDNLYNFLNENKSVTIQIEGHVCCKGMTTVTEGPYSDDNKLSELRAKAVYDYLVAKGIGKNRMKYKGYGTTQPLIYPATTEEEQQQNRRVEIRILTK